MSLTGTVYRAPQRDRHGDPIDYWANPVDMADPDGWAYVGTISGVIIGGQSVSPSRGRQESSDTTGQIGCRRTGSVKLQFGGRIDIDGQRYKVVSRPEWDYPHWTGTSFPLYWVRVEATVG